MRPADIQVIGAELAVKWEDGAETFILLEALRRACPCAGCQGERDIMGQLHKPPAKPLTRESYRILNLQKIGHYGLQPHWADGHATGIYPYELIRSLAEEGT